MTTLQEASTKALDALRKAMQGNLDFDVALEAFEALRTALAQQGEQQGWKLVPVEPTQGMLAKSWIAVAGNLNRVEQREFYSAMLAAAPAPQAQQGEPVAGLNRSYTEQLINALHENSDPVSIDAAEEFQRLLAAALAQQELPQKERPDFMVGYDAGMADAKRMAQHREQQPVCHGCGIPAGDVHMSTCQSGKWPSRVSNGDTAAPAPQPAQGVPETNFGNIPTKFLVNGTRFKLSFDTLGIVSSLWNFMDELDGRWVALVAAEDDYHLQSTQPKQEPLTDEEILSLEKQTPAMNDAGEEWIYFARAIEASHGINGMVEAATRPAIDAASKQGGQHD